MKNPSELSPSGLIIPTDAEDAAINRGIAADPDTVELTAELAARLQPLRRIDNRQVKQRKVGRPK